MFPDAAIHFMHPVKARGAIREAWERHGVRDFVLDSADELAKIRTEIAATGVPGALGLIVRIALPKGGREARPVRQVRRGFRRGRRPAARRPCRRGDAGRQLPCRLAVPRSAGLARRAGADRTDHPAAGVAIDVIDVGGGFPVAYPDQEPPPIGAFFAEIEDGFDRLDLPGRPPVGGTRPRAGGRRDVGGGAGAGSPRRCAVCQRRRLWQPGRRRNAWLSLSGAADPPGRRSRGRNDRRFPCSGRPATAPT